MENCRLYVCKPIFGEADECKKFETYKEYLQWLSLDIENTSFQPICNTKLIFDRLFLTYRSGKVKPVKIT